MKNIIRLNERDLERIILRIIKEGDYYYLKLTKK